MKRGLAILAVSVLFLGLSACKKDYTCVCEVKDDATGDVLSSEEATAKMTKKDAESWCGDQSIKSGGWTTTCSLK